VRQRIRGLDVGSTRFQCHDQLDLEMQIVGLRGIGQLAGRQNVVRVLLKEERRLPVGVRAHFARMLCIVAADAVDAVNWK
jgi:hypothetical protein